MTYSLQRATASDLPEIAKVFMVAMSNDPFYTGMKGHIIYEAEYEYSYSALKPSLTKEEEIGAAETWKVVDENGKILAFAGLGHPATLTEEQKKVFGNRFQLPEGRNHALFDFFQANVVPGPVRNGCDPTKHFRRQNTMVLPEYQRHGLGRMLSEKLNENADQGRAATYVRARPKAAALFIQMGYEVLQRIDFDLSDFGAEGGKTAYFIMKREPGAKEEEGRTLVWS